MIIKINGKSINNAKEYAKKLTIEKPKRNFYNPNTLYSFAPFSSLTLVDTKFLLIGAGIIGIAYIEKKLASLGYVSIAEIIYKSTNIILAAISYGAAYYLIAKSIEVFL